MELAFLLGYFTRGRRSGAARKWTLLLLALTLLLTFGKGAIVTCLMVVAAGGAATVFLGGPLSKRGAVLAVFGVLASVTAIVGFANTNGIDVVELMKVDSEGHAERRADVLKEYFGDDLAPQLFGIGYRQSAKLYSDEMIWYTAHNGYISFLREIGAVGTGIFCLLIACLLVRLFRSGHFGWGYAIIGVLLLSYTETFFYSSHLVLAIGGAVGLACAEPGFRRQVTT